MQSRFSYDEEMQCLVKKNSISESRIHVDNNELYVLQSFLENYLKEKYVENFKMTKEAAKSRVRVLEEQIRSIEKEIVELALKFEIELYRGEYGRDGRELLHYDDSYSGKKRGDWLYSSETC